MATSTLKRVLILTYYWPPSGGSGVQRWLKFSKYLPTFGYQPVVVVPKDADYTLLDESLESDISTSVEVLPLPIREPYAWYRKLTGSSKQESFGPASSAKKGLLKRFSFWIRANLFVPDPKILWVKPTVRALTAYLKENPVDAIISTGPPHSIHLIAKELKNAFPQLPWVLDVRDPWSQFDIHLSFNPSKRALAKNRRLERECLHAADRVIGTAYSMPDHLEPFPKAKYQTLTNGFDAADFTTLSKHKAEKTDNSFTVLHTGLLNAVRNPRSLWEALENYCRGDSGFAERLKLVLIGQVAPEVKQSIDRWPNLKAKVSYIDWVAHKDLITHYAAADVLLLCPNQSENAKSQINGKLFEYLALAKPILHVGPFDADNTVILDRTHAGLTVPPNDVIAQGDALKKFFTGEFSTSPHAHNATEIANFERQNLTAQLTDLLDSLIG